VARTGQTLQPTASAEASTETRATHWHPSRTQLALVLWLVAVAAIILRWGAPTNRFNLFLIITLGLVAASAANPHNILRIVRDWVPLFFLLWVYDKLRSLADTWSSIHVMPQIHLDEWLFGGKVPTVVLQRWLFTPGHPHWYDYMAFFVYVSHFFASFIIAGVLYKVAYPRFKRYMALFIMLTFSAFATYALYPAAPPWWASHETGVLTPTAKIIPEMWVHIGLRSGAAAFSGASNVANPVAAIPSLHSAYPMLIVLFFWKPAGKYRWLLLLYPLAMGFSLVYAAEHYVGDVLLGWLYAAIVYFAGTWALDKWDAWRAARKAAPPLSPAHVT
jgi:hypothetical protein